MLGGQEVRFISKPGLPDWNQINPAAMLLADKIKLPSTARTLLLGCGHGALGVSLARKIYDSELWLIDINYIALRMANLTLQANLVANAYIFSETDLSSSHKEAFDVVVMRIPKGRKLARRWLVKAHYTLRAGGYLYLAGANQHGIQSVIKDAAALFGNSTNLGYKKGNRIAQLEKIPSKSNDPAWSCEPGIAPNTWYKFPLELPGRSLFLHSLPGIFSYHKLDEGTRLLLANLEVPDQAMVLDLGCGYGIIGLMAAMSGANQVDLVDVNLLAVAAAHKNLEYHQINNARIFPSDGTSAVADQRYHLIATNPPFHTGKDVNYIVANAFIAQARQVLIPGGRFLLVSNKFIRYDKLMEKTFDTVERIAETNKYHLLAAS